MMALLRNEYGLTLDVRFEVDESMKNLLDT
jgi:hypothetical protein